MSEMAPIRISDARPLPGFRPWFSNCAETAEPFEAVPISSEHSFSEGWQAGRAQAELDFAEERARLRGMIAACEALQREASEEVGMLIAHAVEQLVRSTVGEVEIDHDLLLTRAQRAAEIVADCDGERRLHVHPDDLALLDGLGLAVTLLSDPCLARGSIRLESATGWIEDGVSTHLDLLREQLGLKDRAQ